MRTKQDYSEEGDEIEESDIYCIDTLEELEIGEHERGFMIGYLGY